MSFNLSFSEPAAHTRGSRFAQTVRLFFGRSVTPPKERARLEISEFKQAMLQTEARTLSLFIKAHQQELRGEHQKARELRGFGEEFWTSACNLEELRHQRADIGVRDGTADKMARTLSLRELDEMVRCAERTSVRVALDEYTRYQAETLDLLTEDGDSLLDGRRRFRQIFRDELEHSPLCRPKSKMSWDAHMTRGRAPQSPRAIARFEGIAQASRQERASMTWIDLMADAALLATQDVPQS